MGEVTRKRFGADFKAKVALEAIGGKLTLAESPASSGAHSSDIMSSGFLEELGPPLALEQNALSANAPAIA